MKSLDSTSVKNVVYTQLLRKHPGKKQVHMMSKLLVRDPYKGKNETKSICFITGLSNKTKVWSMAFLSDWNLWIDIKQRQKQMDT